MVEQDNSVEEIRKKYEKMIENQLERDEEERAERLKQKNPPAILQDFNKRRYEFHGYFTVNELIKLSEFLKTIDS